MLVSLRGSGQPLSPVEIVLEVMTCKDMVAADKTALKRDEHIAQAQKELSDDVD